ncbi:MAG: hypothetical protein AAF267_11675 [Deinococcota bacterium]
MTNSWTASSLPVGRVITAFLGCILTVWIVAYIAGDWTAYQFEHCSNLTQAEVTDKWRHFVNNGAYYYVRYRYSVSPTEQVTANSRRALV